MHATAPQLNSFTDRPPTPAQHFSLCFCAAVLRVLDQVAISFGSHAAALEIFPFLAGYYDELAEHGLDDLTGDGAAAWWRDALADWEAAAPGHLPLRALRLAAGLDHTALTLLLAVGLIEEDPRFGALFEALQDGPGQHRPTVGLLSAWWRQPGGWSEVRTALRRLHDLGLIQVVNPEAPRVEWALQVPGLLWDALRGEVHDAPAPWLRYRPAEVLTPLAELIVPDDLRRALAALPALLAAGEVDALVVRGPRHNGRRTALGALARALGRGCLLVDGVRDAADERWRLIGPLATALHALPVIVLDLGPGETADLPPLPGYVGPLGLALGAGGGVRGDGVARALTLALGMPDAQARRQHWLAGLDRQPVEDLDTIGERFRLTAGNIRRAARLAGTCAALAGRAAVTPADVRAAAGALNRQALDTLAERVSVGGDWGDLAVGAETARELSHLESRCRRREQIGDAVGPALGKQLNAGVRALFSGPSGTGKTLAARALAGALDLDLYRIDLAAVVNKYIGETEKNLSQIFARAEELDVILLLDEGDALLTGRTSVQTSNDRYANLETNYLLQRLEIVRGHPDRHHQRGRPDRRRVPAPDGRGGSLPVARRRRALGDLAAPPAARPHNRPRRAGGGRPALRAIRRPDPQRRVACRAAGARRRRGDHGGAPRGGGAA